MERCYYLVIPVEENEKDGRYDDTTFSVAVKQTDWILRTRSII